MMGGTTQEGTRKTVQKTTQEDVGTARGRRERLREQTDRKIMKATLGIVISDGIGAVTIEEVARRSGVARPQSTDATETPTIYCNASNRKLPDYRISTI